MRRFKVLTMLLAFCGLLGAQEAKMDIYGFSVLDIEGKEVALSRYEGKVLLIVNVASECGFTPQYEGLQALYEKYRERGFMVLGFPCNQFGEQEPGTEAEIHQFCRVNFGVDFDMFSKIDVNGDDTEPLYRYLKSEATGFLGSESIKWNFTKFLVDRKGKVVERFAPMTKPASIEEAIEELL